jgi:hypothetical protein
MKFIGRARGGPGTTIGLNQATLDGQKPKECNVVRVSAGFSGGLSSQSFTENRENWVELVYVRFRSPSLLVPGWTSTRFQMNEGKGKIYGCTFVCNALATGSCNWRPRGWRTTYIWRGDFISLAIGYTSGVQRVRSGYCSSRRENESVVKSVVPTRPANQPPSNPPNQPTSQKTKTSSGPGWEQRIY